MASGSSEASGSPKPPEHATRICHTCLDFKKFTKSQRQTDSDKASEAPSGSSSSSQSSSQKPSTSDAHDCPLGIRGLGRSTWNYLHTVAAYYAYDADAATFNRKPTSQQKQSMTNFLKTYAQFYPCEHCRPDFVEHVKKHPPDVSNADGLSKWMCGLHNSVNDKLSKPLFDCSLDNLYQRWRDGPKDGRCDEVDGGDL